MAVDILFLCNTRAGGRIFKRCEYFLSSYPDIATRSTIIGVDSSEETMKEIGRADRNTVIVAAGGDGTANMTASALLCMGRTDLPLALLPMGTGNALAHSIGLTSAVTAAQALRRLKTGKLSVVRTDHPQKNIALISVSAGIEASIIDSREKWRHGERLRAIRCLSKAAISMTPGISFTVDKIALCSASEALFNAGVYICPSLAFGRRIFPARPPGDFDGWAVAYETPLAYAKALTVGSVCSTGPLGTRHIMGWETAILDTSDRIQIDGELLPGGRVTLRHCPSTLTVVIP